MDSGLRELVRRRAGNRCEYCGLTQEESPLAALQVEHIRPRKHGGSDDADNQALACIDCNLHKGSNIAGFDPETDLMTPLFHPRLDDWDHHFERVGVRIIGLTDVGRTTVIVLHLNSDDRLDLRLAGDTSA